MIKANELRIGNWIEHNANWCYRSPAEIKPFVFQWNERDWYALGECTMDLEDLQPIPLTPEILEKLGFIKDRNYFSIVLFGGTELSYDTVENEWILYDQDNRIVLRNIEYVYQLQNLFYALTGKELEIKSTL